MADEERVVDAPHLPDPQTVACFSVHADEHRLLLRYYCGDAQEPDIAIIFFPSYDTFKFGQPNDEALHGHPLYAKGLSFYRAQEVLNSSWIAELERQNSVHVGHNREGFLRGLRHYTFTGQDRMIECVVNDWRHAAEIHQLKRGAATAVWQRYLDRMD